MKCRFILIVLFLASVLDLSLASISSRSKMDMVQSEVLSYVKQKMGSLRMMRGNSASLQCYDRFIPLINSLAVKARDNSSTCVSNANEKKNKEMASLKDHSSQVAVEVSKITNSLKNCLEARGIEYFMCLRDNADPNIDIMETVKLICEGIRLAHNAKMAEIESDEQICLNDAVDEAKSQTDKTFDDLRKCLKHGI